MTVRCCCIRPAKLPDEVYSKGSMIWSEEDIPGALVLRNFSSPLKRSTYNYRGLNAAMAITSSHWLIYTPNPMIRIEWKDPRAQKLSVSVNAKGRLVISWDANLFQPTWEGSIELRLEVESPERCLKLIKDRLSHHVTAA